MRLEHTFEVPASPDEAWALLMDVPRVIPCMPGAELTEVVDERHWKAAMRVKLGPISLNFATDVELQELDEVARRAKLSAQARETKGRGAGRATIESTLTTANGGARVEVVTDLTLSGPVAQYGRGMVEDVSSQLVSQFADCLKARLSDGPGSVDADGSETAPPRAARPVSGLRLGLKALIRAIPRAVRRVANRLKRRKP